jgi:hypothetical protein
MFLNYSLILTQPILPREHIVIGKDDELTFDEFHTVIQGKILSLMRLKTITDR